MDYNKKKNFIIDTVYTTIILVLTYVFFKYGVGLISPFVFAFLISSSIIKPSRLISKRFKLPQKLVSIVMVLIFYGIIGFLFSLVGIKIYTAVSKFVSNLPSLYGTTIEPFLNSIFSFMGEGIYSLDPSLVMRLDSFSSELISSLGEFIKTVSMKAVSSVSSSAANVPSFFIKFLIMIISTFFISADYENINKFIVKQFPEKWMEVLIQAKRYVVGTLFSCVKSYAIIICITFIEITIGLTILGVKNSVTIAALIAVFDIIPALGTGGIMIPWGIYMIINDRLSLGIGLLCVYIVVTIVRNFLEPKLVGSQIGLHPVVMLMGVFVGVKLFGAIGLFGLPIFISLINNLNKTGAIKLYK